MALVLFATSCSKENNSSMDIPEEEYVEILLNFDIEAEAIVKSTTGWDNFDTIHVWVYEYVNGVIPENAHPVGYVFTTLSAANTASATLQMPAASLDKKFRFFALANPGEFGKIYKARKNYSDTEVELHLQAGITYKDLTTAIFDAKGSSAGIMNTYPNAASPSYMPLSHWVDVETLSTSQAVTIPLYRSVAKTEFYAKIKDGINNGLVQITSITIHSAQRYNVPCEGFIFSNWKTIDNNATSPSIFGEYSNVFVKVPEIYLKNSISEETSTYVSTFCSSNSETLIASNFLYENLFGDLSTDYTSPNNYSTGAYYMKVEYIYGTKATENTFAGGTSKRAVGYVPLPPIVRNKNYKVTATFDINVDGSVSVSYNVVDWANGGSTDLDFSYPTFKISAVKTVEVNDETVIDYSKPMAYYDATTPDLKGFAFKFNITGCARWNATITNETDFAMSVKKNNDEKQAGLTSYSETNVSASNNYIITVYPRNTESTEKTTNIYISYPAAWLGGAHDELLINSGGGGTLWSDSGGERYTIKVTQPADPAQNQ